MCRVLLALAATCLLSSVYSTDTNYRLNTPLKPSAYWLTIKPYFDTGDERQFTFDGEVTIRLTTDTATNQIKLHSQDLTFSIGNVSVTRSDMSSLLTVSNLEFVENYTFALINLTANIQPNLEYEVKIAYRGPIREDLNGFYRNYYLENGVKKWLGATQMEPTHARKAFPCFDEPDLKAEFTLTIDRPQNYKQSLANTEIQSSVQLGNGYIRETFYPTPKMSTYLVAFLVSEFEAAQFIQNGNQEFGVYTRPEAVNQSEYAFDFGRRVVDALGTYFGINYYSTDDHLRLDHIALPDFKAGAMENWGLIKYREALLLYVPEVSTPYYKYRVAQIVAHETTHMWFGNLVTCHWWSNTWLNEGFANYFQDYITSLIEPEVASANALVTGSVYSAYDADDSPTSPPITNVNVNSPAEISGHFGTVTYQKAGSVIRMIHHLIGDEAFKSGLNSYLTKNSFGSGYPNLMYSALHDGVMYSKNSLAGYSANIADVMDSWISQAGHPILHVKIDYDTDTVSLTQKRFYINSTHSSNETYKIPITYTTQASSNFTNTTPAFIMEGTSHEFTITNISQDHRWIIFNVQETGLYRVNYDDHAWQIISAALKGSDAKNIHHLNRAKIVNDLFAFLYADEVSFSRLYDVLEFLSEEIDYSVWYAAVRGFNKLWHSYLGDEALADVQEYALRLVEKGISKIAFDVKSTDDFETLRNRMQLLEFACKLGHQGCVDHTVGLFRALRQNGTEISPSLRPVAYCNGLRYGNGEDYEFLWNRAMSTNVANEARIIGDALGCTTDKEKIQSYLVSMLVENSAIKTQDLTVPLSSVLANYSNLHIVMDSLKSNYSLWASIYPSMDTVLSTVASVLHTESDFQEFEGWLTSCTDCNEQAKSAATNTLIQSKASRSWAEAHKTDILKSLRNLSTKTIPSVMIILAALTVLFVRH